MSTTQRESTRHHLGTPFTLREPVSLTSDGQGNVEALFQDGTKVRVKGFGRRSSAEAARDRALRQAAVYQALAARAPVQD